MARAVIRFEERPVVAAHVEVAVVLDDVRRDWDVGDALEGPVEQVIRDPCPAAGAVHVVLALLEDHSDVPGSIAPGRGDHRSGLQ